jgi:hypothetical protein
LRTVAGGTARRSTRASVGPTLRGFVPPTFPPDVVGIVRIGSSFWEPRYPPEKWPGRFVGAPAVSPGASAERQIVIGRHPFEEVEA